ncbi:ester cyclase [Streptomyces lavendulocolor]|uniref:ester cyclase n=1 Tax=Streptomyces lavendulocolor TaxID=67316 RepID=UPI003CD088D0
MDPSAARPRKPRRPGRPEADTAHAAQHPRRPPVHGRGRVVSGDTAAVRARLSGRQTGEFLGVHPTGRHIEMMSMEIHHITADRIGTTWHVEDFFGALQQMTGPAPA